MSQAKWQSVLYDMQSASLLLAAYVVRGLIQNFVDTAII